MSQEKMQAKELLIHYPPCCTKPVRHDPHGMYQQHESTTWIPPAETLLLRTPTQAQEGQICPQHHPDRDDNDVDK